MKFSNIIKVSVGLGCGLGEVAIPARFDEQGDWIVSASAPGLHSDVKVKLTLNERNWFPVYRVDDPVTIPWTLVGVDGGSYSRNYTYDSRTSRMIGPREAGLGLAPESALLQRSESVALIRASGELLNREGKMVIGSSLPSFLATCVPGTYMHFNRRENDASVRFGDDIARPGKLDFHDLADYVIFAKISQESFDGIKRALRRLGAIPSWDIHQHRNFWRCPAT